MYYEWLIESFSQMILESILEWNKWIIESFTEPVG